jgi:hypothetical protein
VVKRLHRFRIIRVNLKMSNAIHWPILILFVVSIFVMAPDPIHRKIKVFLIATFWDQIEKIVGAD